MNQDLRPLGAQVEVRVLTSHGPVTGPDLRVHGEPDDLAAAHHVGHPHHLLLAAAQQQLGGHGVEGEVTDNLLTQSNKITQLLIQHVESSGSKSWKERVG